MSQPKPNRVRVLERRVRGLLIGFIVGLVLSGATAFPLPSELTMLTHWMGIPDGVSADHYSGLSFWLIRVRDAVVATDRQYPFLAYGTDWLAFAHLVIAGMFVGPIKDPIRNIWVIQWAIFACVATWPLALIAGPIRGIPFYWQMIDCSFGVVGLVPLIVCYRSIRELETLTSATR